MNTPGPIWTFLLALIAWSLTAAAFLAPVSPSGGVPQESAVVQVAAKKSGDPSGQHQSAANPCTETYMYWSTKDRKCRDARNKRSAPPPGVAPQYWLPGSKGGEPACFRGKAGC